MERKQLLCRFHVRGKCRNGDGCLFSHDADTSAPIPDEVCWYYLRDHCAFGDNCRFNHVDAAAILSKHQISCSPSSTIPQPQQLVTETTNQSRVSSTQSPVMQQQLQLLPSLTQETNINNNNSSNNSNFISSDNVSKNKTISDTTNPNQ